MRLVVRAALRPAVQALSAGAVRMLPRLGSLCRLDLQEGGVQSLRRPRTCLEGLALECVATHGRAWCRNMDLSMRLHRFYRREVCPEHHRHAAWNEAGFLRRSLRAAEASATLERLARQTDEANGIAQSLSWIVCGLSNATRQDCARGRVEDGVGGLLQRLCFAPSATRPPGGSKGGGSAPRRRSFPALGAGSRGSAAAGWLGLVSRSALVVCVASRAHHGTAGPSSPTGFDRPCFETARNCASPSLRLRRGDHRRNGQGTGVLRRKAHRALGACRVAWLTCRP